MTFARYKFALELIADGAADPVAIAKEALRSRKPVAKPKVIDPNKKTIEQIQEERRQFRFSVFEQWVADGKPSPKVLGLKFDLSTERVKHCLWRTAMGLWRDKEHPLRQDAAKYIESMYANRS